MNFKYNLCAQGLRKLKGLLEESLKTELQLNLVCSYFHVWNTLEHITQEHNGIQWELKEESKGREE